MPKKQPKRPPQQADASQPGIGELPPVETISLVPGPIKPVSISALELAHLTAHLAQAHLVQGSDKEKTWGAVDFLRRCAMTVADLEDQNVADRYQNAENEMIRPLVAKHAGSAVVPVHDVIVAADLLSVQLTDFELRDLGLPGDFATFTPRDKSAAIFRVLTRQSFVVTRVTVRGSGSTIVKERVFRNAKEWSRKTDEGVPLSDVLNGLLVWLQQAARHRAKNALRAGDAH